MNSSCDSDIRYIVKWRLDEESTVRASNQYEHKVEAERFVYWIEKDVGCFDVWIEETTTW